MLAANNYVKILDDSVITGGTEGEGRGGEVILLLQADELRIMKPENISADSGERFDFIAEVRNGVEFSRKLGARFDEGVFRGGGKPGRVYIVRLAGIEKAKANFQQEQAFLPMCGTKSEESNFSVMSIKQRKGLSQSLRDIGLTDDL